MSLRRKFQRKNKTDQNKSLTLDKMGEMAQNILKPSPRMSEEEAAEMDAELEGIALAALRVELGVSQDDPRSYEELVAELKRQADTA